MVGFEHSGACLGNVAFFVLCMMLAILFTCVARWPFLFMRQSRSGGIVWVNHIFMDLFWLLSRVCLFVLVLL